MNLVDQRCFHHALREAAVQCPTCKRFYCRECVTEHAGRMVCVTCVAAMARSGGESARAKNAKWAAAAVAGVFAAWLVFYYLGLMLARIPDQFHT